MKTSVQKAFLVLFVFVAFSCSKETINDTNINAENITVVETELLQIVNDYRASIGYNALTHSDIAYEQANAHNNYMIAKGNLSHDNFSARASTISIEVDAEYVAENVAKDYSTAKEALKGWLNSIKHKSTIEGEFTHTGISVKKDINNQLYFTQLFFR